MTRYVGKTRVWTYEHVNQHLKRLAEAEAEIASRQQAMEDKKTIIAQKKAMREALDKQCRVDLHRYL